MRKGERERKRERVKVSENLNDTYFCKGWNSNAREKGVTTHLRSLPSAFKETFFTVRNWASSCPMPMTTTVTMLMLTLTSFDQIRGWFFVALVDFVHLLLSFLDILTTVPAFSPVIDRCWQATGETAARSPWSATSLMVSLTNAPATL